MGGAFRLFLGSDIAMKMEKSKKKARKFCERYRKKSAKSRDGKGNEVRNFYPLASRANFRVLRYLSVKLLLGPRRHLLFQLQLTIQAFQPDS